MKRPTPIHLEDIDRKLLADEAARIGASLGAVVRKLIRENLAAPKQVTR
jgi:hypothetical protein